MHRDVRPGSVLIAEGTDSDHPEPVCPTDSGRTQKSPSPTGFTTVGPFVGTLDHVAPEQISGEPVDGRRDVHGFVCVVFETLAGTPPFEREDDMALLWAHQSDAPPAPPVLSALRPDLPSAVDAVLTRALAKSPDGRYDSCGLFVTALRGAAAGTVADGPPLPVADPGTPPERRSERDRPGPSPAPPGWARPVVIGPWAHRALPGARGRCRARLRPGRAPRRAPR
ncbi:serine/threonine protein kinase [Streptomyces clavuligerus]|uniref:Serine/threonine protein kinase n=1 Tax=Streptomyces clavuligerus TaxID=1901 RepID=E2Q780_STRCL|nr:serine/threonine protein kinase [Streptomyces clavuligerus]EFG05327.1 Serine/threonine protein kinase [Streptomyces clavuligerus]